MELRHINYFVAVAEELNFRRAAERLHVSAPALSVQIKKLENMLGVRLCERDTAKVRLTVSGEVLLREARVLLKRVQDMVQATKEAALGTQGCLRIGTPGSFSLDFLPDALNKYRALFPKMDVELVEFQMDDEQPAAVEDGRVHVGFVYENQLHRMSDAGHLLVEDSPLCAVMAEHHPLASLEQVSLAALVKHPLLCSRHFDGQCQHILDLLLKKKLRPENVKNIEGFNTCIVMLAAGEGVALLSTMRALPRTGKLVCRPIKDAASDLRLQTYAVWKKATATPQALYFVDLLRQAGVQRD